VIVDVEGLTFIDASGVYVLIQALKRMSTEGRQLTLRGAESRAYKVLDVCRLTSLLEISDAALGTSGSARPSS
jgi:anti-anti-sigma factor